MDGLDTTQFKQNIFFVEYWFLWEKCSWKIMEVLFTENGIVVCTLEDSMWKENAAFSEVKSSAWCASELGYIQRKMVGRWDGSCH